MKLNRGQYMIIGVSGGIGTGKSTFSLKLHELGAYIIDADSIVHDLYINDIELKDSLTKRFGRDILVNDIVDREKLYDLIKEDKSILIDLNKIVHKRVEEVILNEIKENRNKFIVLDVPIPTKSGFLDICDFIVILKSDLDLRINRIAKRKNISREEARKRISLQADSLEYEKIADIVIENNGTIIDLNNKAEDLYKELQK